MTVSVDREHTLFAFPFTKYFPTKANNNSENIEYSTLNIFSVTILNVIGRNPQPQPRG